MSVREHYEFIAGEYTDHLCAADNLDEFLAPDPYEYSCKVLHMSWMRAAGSDAHWFTCRWMKVLEGVLSPLGICVAYWNENARLPGEWP